MIISESRRHTIFPKVAPMMMPTAMTIIFLRIMNFVNPLSISLPSPGSEMSFHGSYPE